MNIFRSEKEKIKIRVVEKSSVQVTIVKPYKFKGVFLSLFTGLIFSGLFSYGVYVFALSVPIVNQLSSPYSPGATLDPLCSPGTTNCTVYPPLYISNNTLDISPSTFTGGNQLRVKYNSSNYATLTVGTNGDLTVSTNSSGGGGNINFNSASSSNATILSNSGILTLGGTFTGDENLNFDFHDYSDKVVITSGTGVNNIDFGSINLSTTGVLTLGGSTTGTLVTRVSSGAPTQSDTNGSLVVDDAGGRLYFRYGNSWHYIAQTGGFQIPNFETVDPISGEPINQGDFVVGVINESLEDGALHGVWVKWDTLKQQLLQELSIDGGLVIDSTSTVSGEQTQLTTNSTDSTQSSFSQSVADTNLLSKVTNVLSIIGITIKNGITNIKNLAVENFQAKTAKIEKLELVDSKTGEAYCTWIEDGILKTEKGECGSVQVAVNSTNTDQATNEKLQSAADKAAQNAVDKIDNVIQQKVEEEVQDQLTGQQDNSSDVSSVESDSSEDSANQSENNQNQETAPLNEESQTQLQAEENNSSTENKNESETIQPSSVDSLIENSTSALFDRMSLFMNYIKASGHDLSAGLMEPLKYLIESLFSGMKGTVSGSPMSINKSISGIYYGSSFNSYSEYLWIYNPKGIITEAKTNLTNLSNLSKNIFFSVINLRESLASIYR